MHIFGKPYILIVIPILGTTIFNDSHQLSIVCKEKLLLGFMCVKIVLKVVYSPLH